ncbi:hypothetical protein ACFLWY_02875 [Chloroflexota bacterium]
MFELPRKAAVGPEAPGGLSVVVYFCPACGNIELYDLRVLGHI